MSSDTGWPLSRTLRCVATPARDVIGSRTLSGKPVKATWVPSGGTETSNFAGTILYCEATLESPKLAIGVHFTMSMLALAVHSLIANGNQMRASFGTSGFHALTGR